MNQQTCDHLLAAETTGEIGRGGLIFASTLAVEAQSLRKQARSNYDRGARQGQTSPGERFAQDQAARLKRSEELNAMTDVEVLSKDRDYQFFLHCPNCGQKLEHGQAILP
jgi:hypothetical protein